MTTKNKIINFTIIFSMAIISCSAWLCSTFYSQNTSNSETPTQNKVAVPVMMYHFICENNHCKNKFTISSKTFEDDVVYLKENGYETIFVSDLIEYTEGKKDLPKKPILLTFDDGAYNNYVFAFNIAKKHNIKLIFSPIIFETERYSKTEDENANYSHATWQEISEMANSGLVEIQNHTYNMHSCKKPRVGCTKKSSETNDEYQLALSQDLTKAQNLIKEHTNFTPTALFYPFGAMSDKSEQIVKSLGFKATFGCESGINFIGRSPDELFKLKRYLRPPYIPSQKFFAQIDKTVQKYNV